MMTKERVNREKLQLREPSTTQQGTVPHRTVNIN